MIRRILFVCSGNTCRSSMAEALFKEGLARHGAPWASDIVVTSAGVSAAPGEPASKNACGAMESRGIDLSGHRAHRLTADDVRSADLILTMTRAHKRAVLALAPESADKLFTLKELAALMDAPSELRRRWDKLQHQRMGKLMDGQRAAEGRLAELGKRKEDLLRELADVEAEESRVKREVLANVLPEIERAEEMAGSGLDVADPYGADLLTYRKCADEIAAQLDRVLQYLDQTAEGGKRPEE